MLGERIKAKRMEDGMTQDDLALVLDISPAAVGMYEQNRRSPGQKILQKMCLLWDVTADWLLYGITDFSQIASGPVNVHDFLGQIRDELGRQKGLMFDLDETGRRHMLTDEEIEILYEAIRVGAEVALKSKK